MNGDIIVVDIIIEKYIKIFNGDIILFGFFYVLGDIVYKESESVWGKKLDNKFILLISVLVIVDGNIVLYCLVNLDIESDEFK